MIERPPAPPGHHLWRRAEALLRREREGGPKANMDEVIWLWEMARRIRQELPDRIRSAIPVDEADVLWRGAGAKLRHLMAHDGSDAEWNMVYEAFKACDGLERGDHTI